MNTNEITIYLAGKIQKSNETSTEHYWTETEINALKSALQPYSVILLNPADRTDDLTDQQSVFGRDMAQVFSADFIFVDAREKRGLGVGAEMMWAKMHKKPLITLAPEESHYNKKNIYILDKVVESWVHPFVENLSDVIVDTIFEGADWIKKFLNTPGLPIKDAEWIQKSMNYYMKTQFHLDLPMQSISKTSKNVQSKLELLKVE